MVLGRKRAASPSGRASKTPNKRKESPFKPNSTPASNLPPFPPKTNSNKGGDYYLLANDFPSYLEAQQRADDAYRDPTKWNAMSIMSVAGSGACVCVCVCVCACAVYQAFYTSFNILAAAANAPTPPIHLPPPPTPHHTTTPTHPLPE